MGLFDQLRTLLNKPATPTPSPSSEAIEPTQPAVERRAGERANAREGTRVLIIDDSRTVVVALRNMLRSAGYVTLEALDGEKGVELAFAERPDLIFLDIVLPGMDGFAALRLIRRDQLTKNIPVIMMSGNERAAEQYYAERIGADDFMKKPFSRNEVFARIDGLMGADQLPRRKTTPETSRVAAMQG